MGDKKRHTLPKRIFINDVDRYSSMHIAKVTLVKLTLASDNQVAARLSSTSFVTVCILTVSTVFIHFTRGWRRLWRRGSRHRRKFEARRSCFSNSGNCVSFQQRRRWRLSAWKVHGELWLKWQGRLTIFTVSPAMWCTLLPGSRLLKKHYTYL